MRSAVLFLFLLLGSVHLPAEPVLRWAADPNSNAPYSFFAPGKALTGFEYEIINAVAQRIGRRAEFIQNDWSGLIPGLHRGLYDCVICGIEITSEKADQVDFSIPYYFTFEQFVGRRERPPITSLDQLRGEKIGTLDQTAALRMLEQTPGVITKTYDQEISAYQDIVNGRPFWCTARLSDCQILCNTNPLLALNGPPFGRIAYGIAVEKGNSTLQTKIDGALRDLIASGELRNVLSRWGLWADTMAQALNQPAKPSASYSEYQAFVGNQGDQTKFWSRIHIYAAAGRLLRRAALLTLTVSIT